MSKNEKTFNRGTARRRWHRGGSCLDVPYFPQTGDRWWGSLRYHGLDIGFRLVEEVIDE